MSPATGTTHSRSSTSDKEQHVHLEVDEMTYALHIQCSGSAPRVDHIEMIHGDPFPVVPQEMDIRWDIGGERDDMPSSLPYRSVRMVTPESLESGPCTRRIEAQLPHPLPICMLQSVSRGSTHKTNDHIT